MVKLNLLKIILIISVILIVGCENNDSNIIKKIDSKRSIWCEPNNGIAYIIFREGNRGGLTAYLDSTCKPIRCTDVRLKMRDKDD